MPPSTIPGDGTGNCFIKLFDMNTFVVTIHYSYNFILSIVCMVCGIGSING